MGWKIPFLVPTIGSDDTTTVASPSQEEEELVTEAAAADEVEEEERGATTTVNSNNDNSNNDNSNNSSTNGGGDDDDDDYFSIDGIHTFSTVDDDDNFDACSSNNNNNATSSRSSSTNNDDGAKESQSQIQIQIQIQQQQQKQQDDSLMTKGITMGGLVRRYRRKSQGIGRKNNVRDLSNEDNDVEEEKVSYVYGSGTINDSSNTKIGNDRDDVPNNANGGGGIDKSNSTSNGNSKKQKHQQYLGEEPTCSTADTLLNTFSSSSLSSSHIGGGISSTTTNGEETLGEVVNNDRSSNIIAAADDALEKCVVQTGEGFATAEGKQQHKQKSQQSKKEEEAIRQVVVRSSSRTIEIENHASFSQSCMSERDKLQQEVQNLEMELSKMKNEYKQKSSKELAASIVRQQNEAENEKEEVIRISAIKNEMNDKIRLLDDENNRLKITNSIIVNDLKITRVRLEKELATVNNHWKSSGEKVVELEDRTKQLKNDLTHAIRTVDELKKKDEDRQKSSEEKVVELKDRTTQLEHDLASAYRSIDELTKKEAEAVRLQQQEEENKKELELKLSISDKKYEQLQTDCNLLIEKSAATIEEVQQEKKDIEESSDELLRTERSKLEQELKSAQSELEGIRKEKKDIEESSNELLQTERSKSEHELKTARGEISTLQRTQIDSLTVLNQKATLHDEYKMKSDQQIELLRNEREELKKNVQTLSNKECELIKALDGVKSILDSTKIKLDSTIKEKNKIESRLKEEIRRVESKNKEAESRELQQKILLDDAESKIDKLEEQRRSLESMLSILKKKQSNLEEEVCRTEKEHADLQDIHCTTKEEVSKLVARKKELKDILRLSGQNQTDLEKTLHAKINCLENEKCLLHEEKDENNTRLAQTIEVYRTNTSTLQDEINETKTRLEQSQKKKNELSEQVADLQHACEKLKAEQRRIADEKDAAHVIALELADDANTKSSIRQNQLIALRKVEENAKKYAAMEMKRVVYLHAKTMKESAESTACLQKRIDDLQVKYQSLQEEYHETAERKEKKIEALVDEINALQQDHDDMAAKHGVEVEKIMSSHIKEMEERMASNNALETELNSFNKTCESMKHEHRIQIDNIVKAEAKKTQNDIIFLEKSNNDIRTKNAQEVEAVTSILTQRINTATATNEELRNRLEDLQENIKSSRNEEKSNIKAIQIKYDDLLESKAQLIDNHQLELEKAISDTRATTMVNQQLLIDEAEHNLKKAQGDFTSLCEKYENTKNKHRLELEKAISDTCVATMAKQQLLIDEAEKNLQKAQDHVTSLLEEHEKTKNKKEQVASLHSQSLKEAAASNDLLKDKVKKLGESNRKMIKCHHFELEKAISDTRAKVTGELQPLIDVWKESAHKTRCELASLRDEQKKKMQEYANEMDRVASLHTTSLQVSSVSMEAFKKQATLLSRTLQKELVDLQESFEKIKRDNEVMLDDAVANTRATTSAEFCLLIDDMEADATVAQKEIESLKKERERIKDDAAAEIVVLKSAAQKETALLKKERQRIKNDAAAEIVALKSAYSKQADESKKITANLKKQLEDLQEVFEILKEAEKTKTDITVSRIRTKHFTEQQVLIDEANELTKRLQNKIATLEEQQNNIRRTSAAETDALISQHVKTMENANIAANVLQQEVIDLQEGYKKMEENFRLKVEEGLSLTRAKLILEQEVREAEAQLNIAEKGNLRLKMEKEGMKIKSAAEVKNITSLCSQSEEEKWASEKKLKVVEERIFIIFLFAVFLFIYK